MLCCCRKLCRIDVVWGNFIILKSLYAASDIQSNNCDQNFLLVMTWFELCQSRISCFYQWSGEEWILCGTLATTDLKCWHIRTTFGSCSLFTRLLSQSFKNWTCLRLVCPVSFCHSVKFTTFSAILGNVTFNLLNLWHHRIFIMICVLCSLALYMYIKINLSPNNGSLCYIVRKEEEQSLTLFLRQPWV